MNFFVLARQSPEACITRLESILTPWMEQIQHDQHSQLTFRVVEALQEVSIAVLADKLFCSKRTIERSFRRVTGLTLKQYQAMTKLELMLEYLYQKQAWQIDWVDIAFQFGFSDQPHLIRYLKQQIGTTPNKYLLERGFTIDIYGSVSSS
ncbi:helix-turn-helix transcriptional regulator [uncultured Paraglaciecola sp.]|uniref:helix-turn-helix transcriptional regulator n=1 Tax=uncultured Paraglaciecola sp. TaxID=1765024 RepID=UPI002599A83B|nr:helix-turn-helix transcriptional regulator [uncultured Paraglaciecola sp.]